MTLEVPKDLQYGLLDFIAHINAEDFESLPEDFVNLGFTPPNKLEQVHLTHLFFESTPLLNIIVLVSNTYYRRCRLRRAV